MPPIFAALMEAGSGPILRRYAARNRFASAPMIPGWSRIVSAPGLIDQSRHPSPSSARTESLIACPERLVPAARKVTGVPCARHAARSAMTSVSLALDGFRHHLDRAARALGDAEAAALAVVVVELEPLAGSELDDRVVGADAVAVVALEAVAAGQAPARFEERVCVVESALDLIERRLAPEDVEHRAHRLRRVRVVPG